MSLQEELLNHARQAGGSLRTREHRERVLRDFCQYFRQQNIQTRHVSDIKMQQIKGYLESLRTPERTLKLRTLQNSMAAIRTTLKAAGRTKFAAHQALGNKALGIAGASRAGTHKPVEAERYEVVRKLLLSYDRTGGIAAVMRLQWTFGLRALEALRVRADTLLRWKEEMLRGKIHVIEGTKGNRPRMQAVLDSEQATLAIEEAMQALKKGGTQHLVTGKSQTLKSAYDRYHRCLRKYGLTGQSASHGLRYTWAHQAMEQYLRQGMSEREARVLVAQDLGHGDGRGRYVARVYYGKED